MTLGIRKLIVLILAAALFLVANFVLVANWLQEKGVIDWAKYVHREYLTGTAITIIVVLLILLVSPRGEGHRIMRRCQVCDHAAIGKASYCAQCGSKLAWISRDCCVRGWRAEVVVPSRGPDRYSRSGRCN